MNIYRLAYGPVFITAVVAVLVLLPAAANGQDISWLDINGQRWFSSLQEGSDNTLYALQFNYLTNYSSVFYSQDTGYSWAKHSFNYNDIYQYSVNGDHIVMERYIERSSSPHQVFLSTDGGDTFNRILSENYVWHDYVTLCRTKEIFALYTTDWSASARWISQYNEGAWNNIGVSPPISGRSVQFFVDESGNFFLYGYESAKGVVVSTDRGLTWNKTLETKAISAVTADPLGNIIAAGINTSESVPSALYRSTDRGISWTMLIETNDAYFNTLAADGSGNIFGATQRNITVYRLSDGSIEEYAPMNDGFQNILRMSDGSIIASSNDYGLYHSGDGGNTWVPHSPRGQDIYSLALTDAGTVVVGTLGNGILRTTNGGGSWEHVSPDNFSPYVFSLYQGQNYIFAGMDDGAYRSADDGRTWEACNNSYFSGSVNAVTGSGDGDIFIGTNFGLYKSTNNGSDWMLAGLEDLHIMLLTADNSGRIYAVAPTAGIFRLDENIGGTWEIVGPVFDDIQSIAVDSSGKIFAGVYGGVQMSPDGVAWQKISFTNSFIYSLAVNNDQDIIAGSYSGAYISRNGGLSWGFAGLPGSAIMALDFDQDQNLFAGVLKSGVFKSAAAVTSAESDGQLIPEEAALSQNYPNPFNPYTKIAYSIAEKTHVSLKIFNCIGQEIAHIVDERKEPGSYEVIWDGEKLPSGLYFAQLRVEGVIVKTIKMVFIK